MKKCTQLVAAIIFIFGFSACGNDNISLAENAYMPKYIVSIYEYKDKTEIELYPDLDTAQTTKRLVQASFAKNELLEKFASYNEFVEVDYENQRWAISQTRDIFGWNEDNSRRIMFTANKEVGFKFLEARITSFAHAPDFVWLSVNSIYSGWLHPEIPIVITWDDWMVLPYRFVGIWYNEPDNWLERVYAINVIKDDVFLLPVYDLLAVLGTAFEYDNLLAWGGYENLVRGAESPATQVVGFFCYPHLRLASMSVSLPDTWALSWSIMRATADAVLESSESELMLERATQIHDDILHRFADSFVTHDYPWLSDQVTIVLTEDTVQRVHYLLSTTPAIEELEPRHSGHPLHASQAFLIRMEFEDGSKMVVYVCSDTHRFIRTTGTFTWHQDPGIVHARIDELFSLLVSVVLVGFAY